MLRIVLRPRSPRLRPVRFSSARKQRFRRDGRLARVEPLESRLLLVAPFVTTTASALAYAENAGAKVIDSGIVVTDSDSANLNSATVAITGNFVAYQDVLSFTNQLGITGSYKPETGVLTLSGTSSVANYQAALRTVAYTNISDDPTPFARTITFTAKDSSSNGFATRDVNVSATNDAPTATGDTYAVSKGGTLTVTSSAAVIEEYDAVATLNGSTANKPQSKVWKHDGKWWAVFAVSTGTYVWRFDNGTWTQGLQLSSRNGTRSDVKVTGDVAHVLMHRSSGTFLRSIEYVPGGSGSWQLWPTRTTEVTLPALSSLETATLDIDSAGRMWVAYTKDSGTARDVQVIYSDSGYSSWSGPITLATGVDSDDIAAVKALPGKIAVIWSNQQTQRFGFRVHVDGADPNTWSADENPAGGSALNVGSGFADDHLNLQVKADGTVYVAAKTGYNDSDFAKLILLVRRPNGTWDAAYEIDSDRDGTRPIVQLDATTGQLIYAYRDRETDGPIVFRLLTDSGSSISVGAEQVLINGGSTANTVNINDVSGQKAAFAGDALFIASGQSLLSTARISFNRGVLGNDSDNEHNPLTATKIGNPSHGAVTLNADGTFTYVHNNDSATSDSFTYRINDGSANSNTVTVTINITQPQAPVGVADSYAVAKSGTITANDLTGSTATTNDDSVLRNDSAPGGGTLTAVLVAGPSSASAFSLASNGTFTYTHNGNAALTDTFTYRASNGTTQSEITTVTILINQPPVGVANSYTLTKSGTVAATDTTGSTGTTNDDSVLRNDTDANGNALTALLVSGPSSASAFSLNSNGTFSYTHNGNAALSDSFTYRASDGVNQSAITTVTFAINHPPVGVANSYSMVKSATLSATDLTGSTGSTNDDGVLRNDSDPNGEALTAILVAGPSSASSFALNANGSFSYTHNGNSALSDSFTYRASDGTNQSAVTTVTISINQPPTAVANSYSVVKGNTLNASDTTGATATTADDSVLRNDSDPNGSPLTATLVSGPASASAFTLNANGTFSYTHDNGAATGDSFTYQVSDGVHLSNVATVTISIAPASSSTTVSFQDAPGGYNGTRDTMIRGGSSTNYGTATTIDAHGNPDKGSLLSWNIASIPTDSVVQSASITINITNETISTYQLYEMLRGWNETQANWTLAASGTAWGSAGAQQIGVDRANNVLAEFTSSVPVLLTIPLNAAGVAMVQKWVNTPAANFGITIQNYDNGNVGGVGFDSSEATNAATRPKLTITYASGGGTNLPPSAVADSYTVAKGGTLSATDTTGSTGTTNDDSVLRNDSDPENNPLVAELVSGPSNAGAFSLNPNGTFSYTHNNGASTSDSFTYRVSDGTSFSSPVTVSITIAPPPNLSPTAVNNSYALNVGGSLAATDTTGSTGTTNDDSVLRNDTDPENNPLTAILVSGPSSASSFTLNSDGTFTYTHNGNSATSDSFTYRAFDGTTQSNIATASFSINQPPVAVANSYSVVKGGTLSANDTTGSTGTTGDDSVLRNDSDPNGNSLTAILVSGPSSASAFTLNANGTFSYTHNNGAATSDSFTYQVSDGVNLSNIVTASITITPPASGTTVSFQDGIGGYTGTRDTTIKASGANSNYGTVKTVDAHGNPDKGSLVSWNVASIPTNAVVQSASITLNVTNETISTYQLYAMLRSWNETQATWSRASTSSTWGSAGAQQIGVDRANTVLANFTTDVPATITIVFDAAGIALVQQWVNTPSSNFGITIQNYDNGNVGGVGFDSREATTAANRPKLTVTYTLGALTAAASPIVESAAPPLTQSAVDSVLEAAQARVLAALPGGARDAALVALGSLSVGIADLSGRLLGTSGSTILLDRNAAGFGWWVDATPWDDAEFSSVDGRALPSGTAAVGIDLVSALAHELGHAIGQSHRDSADFMEESLGAGFRSALVPVGLDSVFASTADGGTLFDLLASAG